MGAATSQTYLKHHKTMHRESWKYQVQASCGCWIEKCSRIAIAWRRCPESGEDILQSLHLESWDRFTKLKRIDEKWVLCLIDIVLIKYWFMFDRNPQDNLGVITSLDLLPPISPSTTTFGVLRGNVTTALHKGTQLPVACDALTWPGWKSWWSHLAYKHWQTACGLQKCWLFERLAPTWRFGSRHEAKPTRDEPVWLDLYKCNSCQSLAAPICKEMLKRVKWIAVKEKNIYLGVIATWPSTVIIFALLQAAIPHSLSWQAWTDLPGCRLMLKLHHKVWVNMFRLSINILANFIMFHQPRFPWNKGFSRTKPFGVRSCEVAIIWQEYWIILTWDQWGDAMKFLHKNF